VNGFIVALAVAAGLFGSVDRGPAMPVCGVDIPCDEPAANVALVFTRQGKTIRTRTDDKVAIALGSLRATTQFARPEKASVS
jgi:hypothetical protein